VLGHLNLQVVFHSSTLEIVWSFTLIHKKPPPERRGPGGEASRKKHQIYSSAVPFKIRDDSC
jgi:hypothetical protein